MRACMPGRFLSLYCWCNQVLMALLTSSSDSNFLPKTGVRRGENLRTLRRGCKVDVLTPLVQVVWWPPESWRWCEASRYRAEATFSVKSCQLERVGSAFSYFFSVLIHSSELTVFPLCITPRRITPQSQNAVTVTFLADGERQGAKFAVCMTVHH